VTALGETLQFLRSRGFTRIASTNPTVRVFDGCLRVSAGRVPVRLEIVDWDFLSYPRIAIQEYPKFLPSPMPHLDATGGLCYLAHGSVVLDRFETASAIALCLGEAEKLLEKIITSPSRRSTDVQDEFLAYWAGGANRTWALIGKIDSKAATAQCSIVDLPQERLDGARLIIISSTQAEVENLARSIGGKISVHQFSPCWVFDSVIRPVAPERLLPTTVIEVFKYLRRWDESLYRSVQRVLGTDREYLKYSKARFAIRTPSGWLGFSFDLNPVLKKGFARKPQLYRQHLHGKGGATSISRMTLMEFGTDFLHARNLDSPTLAGKRIYLVGCGAVGSYLAQSLARLGAGSLGGVLRLIDPEILEPDNVGRHWLGMSSLFLPKAQAIASQLNLQFPESTFLSEITDVRNVRGLFDANLVIDATGIEALSEVINATHCEKDRAKASPILHVWVLGNGEAVQGLWVDSAKFGCYRCLRLPKGSQYRQERFPVLTCEPIMRMAGCSEYRPYAVSAPMSAAVLATEFVVDWLTGDPSPRFRTYAREGSAVRKQKNQNFDPVRGCPACAR
jgi:hypothetical protein